MVAALDVPFWVNPRIGDLLPFMEGRSGLPRSLQDGRVGSLSLDNPVLGQGEINLLRLRREDYLDLVSERGPLLLRKPFRLPEMVNPVGKLPRVGRCIELWYQYIGFFFSILSKHEPPRFAPLTSFHVFHSFPLPSSLFSNPKGQIGSPTPHPNFFFPTFDSPLLPAPPFF
ncbi:uncharacterized protein EI90DRAFT_157539 [Cantharellus anzutake]|uniref:uncharacterized protein n=1 Tax=Cantharellus anzutake TaxID=1750568 RepID=UPI00190578C1|nr:uncharacterized protein EI90DRAFT_157539 [Cantharellus anzutake]KAF8336309.1 hypothetical protein EI90DRAFT_157539 [Cantharellus anzutake]